MRCKWLQGFQENPGRCVEGKPLVDAEHPILDFCFGCGHPPHRPKDDEMSIYCDPKNMKKEEKTYENCPIYKQKLGV